MPSLNAANNLVFLGRDKVMVGLSFLALVAVVKTMDEFCYSRLWGDASSVAEPGKQ